MSIRSDKKVVNAIKNDGAEIILAEKPEKVEQEERPLADLKRERDEIGANLGRLDYLLQDHDQS